MVVSVVVLACLATAPGLAQRGGGGRGRISGEGFIREGVPKMPNPPGPAPKRDLSGVWVGPNGNKAERVPPMTPAGEALFKERKGYGNASRVVGASNDPFITCDPLGFPRNLLAHAVSSRGRFIVASAPDRLLFAYEQQRVWREIWMDGRALPKAVATATLNPAHLVGLDDRGEIAPGKRADYVRVRESRGVPVPLETWRDGKRIA